MPGQVLGKCLIYKVRLGLSGTSAPISHIIQSLLISLAEVGGEGMDVWRPPATGHRSKRFVLMGDGFGIDTPAYENLYLKRLLVATNAHHPGDEVSDGMHVSLHELRKDGGTTMAHNWLMTQFTSFL